MQENTSREKVIWNDATKAYIHTVIEKATKEAEGIVEKDLKDATEFFDWIRRCRAIFSKMDNTSVLGRLSNIIETNTLSPKFPMNRNIKYGSFNSMFPGVIVERVTIDWKGKAKREVVERWDQTGSIEKEHLFIKDSKYSPAKDLYLCKSLGRESFLTFQPALMSEEEKVKLRQKNPETANELIRKHENKATAVWALIEGSPDVELYSEIEVPDHIKEQVEKVAEKEELDMLSPAEMRKMEGKEVGYTLRYDTNKVSYNTFPKHWTLDKVEPKKKDLLLTEDEVFYTSGLEKETLIEAACMLEGASPSCQDVYGIKYGYAWREPSLFRVSPSLNYHSNQFNPEDYVNTPQLIQLSADIIRKIPNSSNLRPVCELYNRREHDTVMTMHPDVVNAYTAYKLGAEWEKFAYIDNFKGIDNVIYTKYRQLKDFMNIYTSDGVTNNIDLFNLDGTGEILKHADVLYDMQMFCRGERTEEEVAQKSFELFIFSDVTDAVAVNMEIVDLYNELTDYNEGVGDLLNLLDEECFLNDDGAGEIQRYLKARDRDNWQWESE